MIFKKFCPYEVDFDHLNEKVDFFITTASHDPKKEGFWDLIKLFKDKKIIKPIQAGFYRQFSVDCEDGKYEIQCDDIIGRQILSILLMLLSENKSIECFWYFYDHNVCNEMPQFIDSFFLVDGTKIISECVRISTSWEKNDTNILVESSTVKCHNSSTPLWRNMEADQRASTLWCYQNFYQETITGQILAIREQPNVLPISMTRATPHQISLLSSIDKSLKWLILGAGLMLVRMFF